MRCTIISLIILLYSSPGFAQISKQPLSKDHIESYIERYVKAINTNDLEIYKASMHPDFLACSNRKNKDYYNNIFHKTLNLHISENFKLKFFKLTEDTIKNEMVVAQALGVPYPTAPTHMFQIDFIDNNISYTITRKLRKEGEEYYEVTGCPTDEMVKKFRFKNKEDKKFKKRAKRLFKKIEDPLRKELVNLIAQGQQMSAWKRYSEETGESQAMAQIVITMIENNDK